MTNIPLEEAVISLKMSFGLCIMALLDGGLLILGVICILLLFPNDSQPSKQHKLLRGYIIILLLINMIYLAAYFLKSHFPLLYAIVNYPVNGGQIVTVLFYLTNVVPILILSLTDGLLVWRCYRVQRVLGGYHGRYRWRRIFWAFPLCLWAMTTVIGLVGACTVGTLEAIASLLETTALASNALANVFATCFIVARLILHRRTTIERCGYQAPNLRHFHIVSILLQSAAVNVPITIIAAVGVAGNQVLGAVAAPVAVSCQSFSSILIIHQVALRRAIDELKGDERRTTEGQELTSGLALSDHPAMSI